MTTETLLNIEALESADEAFEAFQAELAAKRAEFVGPVAPVTPASELTLACSNVEAVFDRFNGDSNELHERMVALLTVLSRMSKKDIKGAPALRALFERKIHGVDRARLVSWVHAHAPIRLLFKANGHFDAIGWSASHAKNKGWMLPEASLERWFTFEPEKKPAKVGDASLSKGLDALVNQLARRAYELGSVEKARAELDSLINAELVSRLGKKLTSEAHKTWIEKKSEA